MTWQDIAVLLNLVVTVCGGIFFLARMDARLVRVETLLEFVLPKQNRGGEGGAHESR